MFRNLPQRGAALLHRTMVKLLRRLGERRLARGGSLASRGLLWTNRCLTHHAAALMRRGPLRRAASPGGRGRKHLKYRSGGGIMIE